MRLSHARVHFSNLREALIPGPDNSEPAQSHTEVARWATINHDRLVVTMLHNTVGVTLWFVFGAAVYAVLRDRLPTRSMLPMCFATSFFGCVTLLLSGFTAFNLLLYRRHSAEASILLYDLTFGLLAMSRMPTVVALGSFAVAVYVHQALPRYTAHLAVAGAAVHPLLLVTFHRARWSALA